MSDIQGPIHLVLPDATERAACFRALATGAHIVRSFASADAYCDAEADRLGGILLFHWQQPGAIDGAALLRRVATRRDVIAFVAARRLNLAESRALLRGGAHDLLPAPLDPLRVRRALNAALGDWEARRRALALARDAELRLETLTPREHDILDAIAAGLGNKAIARRLDLSPRTVEVHRANIMRRAGAASVAELLRMQFIAEQARGEAAIPIQYGARSSAPAAAHDADRV